LLQETWSALEDAGYGERRLRAGTIGMFVGAEQGDYAELTGGEGGITAQHEAIMAARLAYLLDFSGPVLTVNTACSSGLTAAHQAGPHRDGQVRDALREWRLPRLRQAGRRHGPR